MNTNYDYVDISDEQFIDIVGKAARMIHYAIAAENTILISNREVITHYIMGDEAVKSELVGKPFSTSGNIPKTLSTGMKQTSILPKEIYGAAFKSSCVPISNDDGDIIGTVSISFSMKNQQALQDVTNDLSSSAAQLNSATQEISNSAISLSSDVAELLAEAEEIMKMTDQTNNILDLVKNVSLNSRILGINAAIEATRAGSSGKGFSVVADEIRKMAEYTEKSVSTSQDLISGIRGKVSDLLKKTKNLSDIAVTQAAATQETAASIHQLSKNADVVKEISEII